MPKHKRPLPSLFPRNFHETLSLNSLIISQFHSQLIVVESHKVKCWPDFESKLELKKAPFGRTQTICTHMMVELEQWQTELCKRLCCRQNWWHSGLIFSVFILFWDCRRTHLVCQHEVPGLLRKLGFPCSLIQAARNYFILKLVPYKVQKLLCLQ